MQVIEYLAFCLRVLSCKDWDWSGPYTKVEVKLCAGTEEVEKDGSRKWCQGLYGASGRVAWKCGDRYLGTGLDDPPAPPGM